MFSGPVNAAPVESDARTESLSQGDGDDRAPLRMAAAGGVEDSYIVVLNAEPGQASARSAAFSARSAARSAGADIEHEYRNVLNGFSATMNDRAVETLRANPAVAYIEQNVSMVPDVDQTDPPWGLDRIDQADLPPDANYSYDQTGAGVDVYVIDTGVRATHEQFGGRVAAGRNFAADRPVDDVTDCNGHGTHVAGIVAAATQGVAKEANIIPVRVFGCNALGEPVGNAAVTIAGMDWVLANADGPSVVNMSLGSRGARPVQANLDAVDRLADANIVVVASAGNTPEEATEPRDACLQSPAAAPVAITVASSTRADRRRGDSNWGPCVDLFAPGTDIESLGFVDDTGLRSISGTSMAAPHVAGVAALFLEANPRATVAEVTNAIVGGATPGVMADDNLRGSPDLMLFSQIVETPETPFGAPVIRVDGNTISWDAVGQAEGYNVYRNGGYLTTVVSETSYNATQSGSYYLHAFDRDTTPIRFSSRSNEVDVGDSSTDRPSAPTIRATGTTISWNSVGSATGYNVYGNGRYLTTVSSTFYVASESGTYYVHAFNKNATPTVFSTRSNEVTIGESSETRPATPTIRSLGSSLAWPAVDGATGYNVYVDDDYLTTVQDPSFAVTQPGEYYVISFNQNASPILYSGKSNRVDVN